MPICRVEEESKTSDVVSHMNGEVFENILKGYMRKYDEIAVNGLETGGLKSIKVEE